MNGTRPGWLAEQLPRPLAEDHFTRQFLRIFEDVAGDVRRRVDGFRDYLDVRLAPAEFVRWMGGWLGLAVDPALPEEHQRSLVMAAGPLFPWRGTRRGLQGLLEALTRAPVQIEEGGGVFLEGEAPANSGRIVIKLTATGGLNEQHLLDLARLEIPANASVELRVGRRRVKEQGPETENEPSGPEAPGTRDTAAPEEPAAPSASDTPPAGPPEAPES
jgi:phage tail-like protein